MQNNQHIEASLLRAGSDIRMACNEEDSTGNEKLMKEHPIAGRRPRRVEAHRNSVW
jgi:hypothetical protein